MKIRTIFLLFVLILMAVFLVINWTALSTVTAVNLIYTEIQLRSAFSSWAVSPRWSSCCSSTWSGSRPASRLSFAPPTRSSQRPHRADDAEKSRFAESNRILLERIEKLEALMTPAPTRRSPPSVRSRPC